MRALIFGTTGQVARELALRGEGIEITALGRDAVDLANAVDCARAVRESGADVVINSAAHTAVDRAENEPELAYAVNARAPGAMAVAAAEKGIPFLHVSTDYVFDGAPGGAWSEGDATGPLGVYGASKLEGERAVIAAGGDHVILRTAWVFSAHGNNFVKTMLRHGATREEMRVVADQMGGPTAARDIAGALWTIARAWKAGEGRSGVFHYAGAPSVSWAGFAEAIFARSGWEKIPRVVPITTADYPTPAKRPANSVLDCRAIEQAYGIAQPDWQVALDSVIHELMRETA